MSVFEMRASGIALALDLSVGHVADLSIERDGRLIRPLHRAPWVDDPNVWFADGTPANVRRLSGDFFCAPFSANDVEEGPPHGWPANSEWELVNETELADGRRAHFRLRKQVMGATVDKLLTLRDRHPFLYQEHVLRGGEGAVPVAHHTMVRMADVGAITYSAKKAALTPDRALESDPARGRSIFRYPAHTSDIRELPLADGGTADLTNFPPGERHEDFVTLVEAPHEGPGFTACVRRAERDLVLVLKDSAALPVTMLWFSNGGRDYVPWNGRHVGVLGIEDGCSAVGHAQSLGDNAIRREGVPTAVPLRPDGKVAVRQIVGALPVDARQRVGSIVPDAGMIAIRFVDGDSLTAPFDSGFLSPSG